MTFDWVKATREEKRQHAAQTARAERIAAGQPPTIQNDEFYTLAARILASVKPKDVE